MTGNRTGLLQSFSSSVRGIDSSGQLALGIAVGMMMGFLPKDNLMFFGFVILLIISGANLVTGILACVGASLIAPLLESGIHQTGKAVLETEFAVTTISKFFESPLAAWTRLDNTLVCGSFVIGLALFVPIYLVSFAMFARNRESLQRLLTQSKLVNWIVGYTPQESLES